MGLIMVLIIHIKIIRPLNYLSKTMSRKQDKAKMLKFVNKIQKQSDREKRRYQNSIKKKEKRRKYLAKLKVEIDILESSEEEVDETQ
jgi:hypothetical protein